MTEKNLIEKRMKIIIEIDVSQARHNINVSLEFIWESLEVES